MTRERTPSAPVSAGNFLVLMSHDLCLAAFTVMFILGSRAFSLDLKNCCSKGHQAGGSIPSTATMGRGGGGVVRSGVSLMKVLVAAAPGLGKPLTRPSLTFPRGRLLPRFPPAQSGCRHDMDNPRRHSFGNFTARACSDCPSDCLPRLQS